MRGSLLLPLPALFGFLLVFTRVAGVIAFVPMPGIERVPSPARVMMAMALTFALFPQWPLVAAMPDGGRLAGWLVIEAGFGLMTGLLVSFLSDSLLMMAQLVGLPAGYGYASMIDPQTQADSGVLLIFAQLSAGMLFFSLGLDREMVRVFARSLETMPPGSVTLPASAAESLVRLGSGFFTVGVRLALPAAALLMTVDLALALLGRIHAQLQLMVIAFPVKMLVAVAVMAWTVVLFPRLYSEYATAGLSVVRGLTR